MNSDTSRTADMATSIQASFTFICPHCEQPLEAEPDMVGMEMKCPTCALPITVPAPFSQEEKFTAELAGSSIGDVLSEIENLELGNNLQHSMIASCPQCGHKWECDDSFDGSFGECPACGKGFILSSGKPKAAKSTPKAAQSTKPPKADISKTKVDAGKKEDVAATFKFSRLIPLAICCLGFGWLSGRTPFATENVIYASNRWQILPIGALALFGSFCGIRHFIRPQKIPWDLLIAICIFTAFVGVKMLFWVQGAASFAAESGINVKGDVRFKFFYSILQIIGESYNAVNHNQGKFFDWIVSAGFCEESVKLLPLLLLLAFRNKLSFKMPLSFRTFLLLGFFSGLGFGIAEALSDGYCLTSLKSLLSELSILPHPGPEPFPPSLSPPTQPSIDSFMRSVIVGQGFGAYRAVVPDLAAYKAAVGRYNAALQSYNAAIENYHAAVAVWNTQVANLNAAIEVVRNGFARNLLSGHLLRWFACVPSHAIYTVVDAAFLWILYKRISRSVYIVGKFLWFTACVSVIAALHGIYDTLCNTTNYGIVLDAASFVLMWWIVRLASRVMVDAGDCGLAESEDMETQSAFTRKTFLMIFFAITIAIVVYAAIMCKSKSELNVLLQQL